MENATLQHACSLVSSNQLTMARAAEQYGVSVNQIGSLLAWEKVVPLTEKETRRVEKVGGFPSLSDTCWVVGRGSTEIVGRKTVFRDWNHRFVGDGHRLLSDEHHSEVSSSH